MHSIKKKVEEEVKFVFKHLVELKNNIKIVLSF